MDAADLIRSFTTNGITGYTVTRRGAVAFVRGRNVPLQSSTLNIKACVTPATGRDLMRVPEGRRSVETRVLYTTTQLYAGAQAGPNEADLVTVDGQTWEVQHAERWESVDPTYWRCIIQAVVSPTSQVAV